MHKCEVGSVESRVNIHTDISLLVHMIYEIEALTKQSNQKYAYILSIFFLLFFYFI